MAGLIRLKTMDKAPTYLVLPLVLLMITFRPSTPHIDRRIDAAQTVYNQMTAPQPVQEPAPTPKPQNVGPAIPSFKSGRMAGRAAFQ